MTLVIILLICGCCSLWEMKTLFSQTYTARIFFIYESICMYIVKHLGRHSYDMVSGNGAISEPKTSKFQSGHRVVKMVLDT